MTDSQNIKDQVSHVIALQLTRQRQEKEATLRRHIFFLNICFWLMLASFVLFLTLDIKLVSEGTFRLDNVPGPLLTALATLGILRRMGGLTSELGRTTQSVAT